MPSTPIKFGRAPQKIMYLADDHFQKRGLGDNTNMIFATPGTVKFGTKDFADTLTKVIKRKDISARFFYAPASIDPLKKEVRFRYTGVPRNGKASRPSTKRWVWIGWLPCLMICCAWRRRNQPRILSKNRYSLSRMGANQGWLDVNIHSLQYNRFPNVYGLSDVAALPTAKTGAAIIKQAPVVVFDILSELEEKSEPQMYNGYSSCPLVTGYGKMLLTEFKYGNERDRDPFLSRILDTTKEHWSM